MKCARNVEKKYRDSPLSAMSVMPISSKQTRSPSKPKNRSAWTKRSAERTGSRSDGFRKSSERALSHSGSVDIGRDHCGVLSCITATEPSDTTRYQWAQLLLRELARLRRTEEKDFRVEMTPSNLTYPKSGLKGPSVWGFISQVLP